METIFRKVLITERLPTEVCFCFVITKNNYKDLRLFNLESKKFKNDQYTEDAVYWLEEINFENEETNCKCCDNQDVQWNKIEIDVGDRKGSYKDLSYNYCNNCGATFNEEID